jgi:hypothetical protein
MKKLSIFLFVVFAIGFAISCNKTNNKKQEGQKQVAQTQQSKPALAPAPAKPDTAKAKQPEKVAAPKEEAVHKISNADDLLGKWASKSSGMKATILKSKLGYYIQYDFGPVNSFYGNYKLVDGELVCIKPTTYADGGEIENEYVRKPRFRQSSDGRSLIFSCIDCETMTLYRVN